MYDNNNREKLSSRLGFLLVSAGCAIGLGNVWRFPYITGKYGGALFCFALFNFSYHIRASYTGNGIFSWKSRKKRFSRFLQSIAEKKVINGIL